MAETHWIGTSLKRKEDPSLLTGRGSYVDDVRLPGMLHAAILGSPHPHARIKSIDIGEALKLPGVAAVLTGRDVARRILPFTSFVGGPAIDFGIAVDKTRYVGEPVVLVAATDRYTAEDARDLIRVEYEPLPAAVDAEAALAPGAPLLYEAMGSNLFWRRAFTYGDPDGAFQQAEVVVKDRFYFHRYSSTPIETCGVVASYDLARDSLTFWDNNQLPMRVAPFVSLMLKMPSSRVRFIEGNIGGGYGNKALIFAYNVLVGLLSKEAGRPVKWIADRREDLTAASIHCANVLTEAEFALKRDGTILGMRLNVIQDFGSFLKRPEPINILRAFQSFTGCYRIPNVLIDAHAVVTNKCPTGPNRGYGLHQHYFVLERMVDKAAKDLGLDPTEIRFRNFIQPQEMPHTAPNGCVYDSGDYPETLHRALEMIGYDEFRREQARLRQEGRYLGVGLATIVEPSASNAAVLSGLLPPGSRLLPPMFSGEAAGVRLEASGKVVVALGTVPQGQGHETVAAQIVADELGLHPDDITVLTGFDSATHPHTDTSGTYASVFTAVGAPAILEAARKVREKLLAVAAHLLGAQPQELALEKGTVYVREAPEKAMPMDRIAFLAHNRSFPPDIDTSLEATHIYQVPFFEEPDEELRGRLATTYANSAHAAVVEVDPGTGEVKVRRYVVVHDCGRMLNPMIVDGQIHGGVAHGLGGALYEEHIYDEKGQYLTATFMDYPPPYATEIPEMEVAHLESPSPFTPLGAKGMGEGGSMPVPALIANAVEDALAPLGVKVDRLPLTPGRVWGLMREAKQS